MTRMLAALALFFAGTAAVLSFDSATQAIIDRYKAQKPVAGADLAKLMQASERWCYAEDAGACSWSDIYLDVTPEGAQFEISNAWSEAIDIAYVESGVFKDRRLCETGLDWIHTVYGINRADNTAIRGRALHAIKEQLTANQLEPVIDCFDYLYVSSDPQRQTVTLLQRQYADNVYQADADVTVTLHFDPDTATGLALRW